MATVGVLQVKDGSGNVIPGEVVFTLDVRAPRDALRKAVEKRILAAFVAIARRRGVRLERDRTHEIGAAPCAPWLQKRLGASVGRVTGRPARRLPSGAGHDAMIFADVTDVGMLFVRCGAGGVSHNPGETVAPRDAALAAAALLDFLRHFPSR